MTIADSEKKSGRTFPDTWLNPVSGVRILVLAWEPLRPVADQFIERPRSLRMLWSYLRHVGLVTVVRKVHSRRAEAARNRKVMALGAGVVHQAGSDAKLEKGEAVVLLAVNHPQSPNRVVVVDRRFVRTQAWLRQAKREFGGTDNEYVDYMAALSPWLGWSPFSGLRLEETDIEKALRSVVPRFLALEERAREQTDREHDVEITERIESPSPRKAKSGVVIYGLGNYAKTQILPVVGKTLGVSCIHEVDPDQFQGVAKSRATLDSSPVPRAEECYAAWFIAGYHHTHAPLAIEALRRGAYAVVEKPVATTREQYDELLGQLMELRSPLLFSCFQKRYSTLHEWACEDLECGKGESVDMYASVFEIPLPRYHWYNWPVSGSRMVSNGCHWLDYFMFINGYAEVDKAEVVPLGNSDLLATVRLGNGARLVLSLTDTGSARLGVRELIELRRGDTTVRITDASRYESENTSRVLRRRSVNPVKAYNRMYKEICRRIGSGESADSLESLRSTDLMLRLESQLQDCGETNVMNSSGLDRHMRGIL